MGVGYALVNHSRAEIIGFAHIPASMKRELAGHAVAAAIVTWYLLEHPGDAIAFVSDTHDDWPFPSGNRADLAAYTDVTDTVVDGLIAAGILRDNGRQEFGEPGAYMRLLEHVWFE